MNIIETPLKDLYILEPRVFEDQRGYFFESYNKQAIEGKVPDYTFVQDNQSHSAYGVLRGLHYQLNPNAQAKLVRVLFGKVFDVAVDIRTGSPTFGQWFGCELSSENKRQLLIPRGFAHGFSVLSPEATLFYKCDNYYSPADDAGIRFDDPQLNIDWQIPSNKIILSEKDAKLPLFSNAKNNF